MHKVPVSQVVQEHGPFLPYSLLFGRPLDDENPFPIWINLLQKGLWGWGYWAESWDDALTLARAGALSLALTSSPRQVVFWCLGPRAEALADFRLPGDHAFQVKRVTDVLETLRERRRSRYRGPQHIVVFLAGPGPVADVKDLFQYGPLHALWPVPVATQDESAFLDLARAHGLIRVEQVSDEEAWVRGTTAHRILPYYPA